MRPLLNRILPFVIAGVVLFMLGSLHFGWLHAFFFDAEHADVQGIDYFSIPKAYLNLLDKRSAYDTWGGPQYGPHSTWYLAHPAFTVFVASWFSYFPPWVSYWLFVIFSVGLMAYSGYLISQLTSSPLIKRLSFALILCAFPTYWMLFVGNMHAPLVLALTLIFIGVFELAYADNDEARKLANMKLFLGLIISFFTKPIVLLMLPLLLLLKETRKTTFVCLVIYGIVSFLFVVLPVLNPEGVGISKLLSLDTDFIKGHMNIYKNNFVLNEYMKDNSIHWLNLIAQSDYKLMHIDVFSLPVFTDTLVGHETPARLYKIPIYISLLLSIGVFFMKDKKVQMETALLLLMGISLTFFLSYNTVWEYQFASALPIVALLLILKEKGVFYNKYIPFMFIIGLMFCLPSFYFLVRHSGELGSNMTLTTIRFDRIVPALVLFVIMIVLVIAAILKNLGGKKDLPAGI